MEIDEAKLYLEHISKDDFNLEKWQKENRYQAIQVVLEEIERLHSIIKEVREYIHKNCISSDEWTDLDFCHFIPTGKIIYKQLTPKKVKELLEILDKEEE